MSPHKNNEIRTTGSIDVERVAKPLALLSDTILCKGHCSFSSGSKSSLFNEGKEQLKGEIHDTLDADYDIDATAYDIDTVNDSMDC